MVATEDSSVGRFDPVQKKIIGFCLLRMTIV